MYDDCSEDRVEHPQSASSSFFTSYLPKLITVTENLDEASSPGPTLWSITLDFSVHCSIAELPERIEKPAKRRITA